MKQFVAILLLTVCASLTASAQTFLERLQRQQKNQGKVTVTQSAAIDELVNGNKNATTPSTSSVSTTTKTSSVANTTVVGTHTDNRKQYTETVKKQEYSEKNSSHTTKQESENHKKTEEKAVTTEIATPTIDMRKKVMANSYKVTGYRVQAFAGGNTREDRQKAEQARSIIKKNFPEEPIYVHFYSPRWICRVGNYRSYEEAHRMLVEIRKLGYKGASIVKGKISVQY